MIFSIWTRGIKFLGKNLIILLWSGLWNCKYLYFSLHHFFFSVQYFITNLTCIYSEQKNYELDLFTDYTPNQFTLLNNTDAAKYFPELEVSIRTKVESTSNESHNNEIPWKQWKRFEGGFDTGNYFYIIILELHDY